MFLEHTHRPLSVAVIRPGTLPDHNLTASSRTHCPARSVKFPVGKKQISKNPRSVHLLFKSHSWREPTHAYPALCIRVQCFSRAHIFDTPFFSIYIISAKNYRTPRVLALGGAVYVVGGTGKMYTAVVYCHAWMGKSHKAPRAFHVFIVVSLGDWVTPPPIK